MLDPVAFPNLRLLPALRRSLNRQVLAEQIARLGITAGDTLVVHSSLHAIGRITPDPSALVLAFQDVLTPAGTLVMPTFTYCLESWDLGAFDPLSTAGRTGLLPEVFRRMPEVLRSRHPTHSVAAWGAGAAEITAPDPWSHTPLGIGSPLDLARRRGALVLLVGVGHERNSMIHIGEAVARVPYLSVAFTHHRDHEIALSVNSSGGVDRTTLREIPGSSEGFPALEPMLTAAGIQSQGRLGGAETRLLNAETLVHTAIQALRADPAIFLRGPSPSEISRRLEYLASIPETEEAPR